MDGDPTNNRLDNLEWDVDKTYGLPPSPRARNWTITIIFIIFAKKCRWVFNRFYKKYKGRHQYVYFSQFANKEDGNCFADNIAEPSYKGIL